VSTCSPIATVRPLNHSAKGPDAPEQISCLAMDGDAVWAAAGPHVLKYLRGKEVMPLLFAYHFFFFDLAAGLASN
jgi:hypothetical protein